MIKFLISGGVGVGGILKAVKRLLVYDIQTNEWQKGPSMNHVRIKKTLHIRTYVQILTYLGKKMPWINGYK